MSDAATSTDSRLVRAVGVLGLAAGIVNITIGGGIFRLPAFAAKELGAAAPLAYVVCAVAMALIVLCFAEAGSRVSLTGGPYAYVEVAFGPFAGFLSGVLLWVVGTFALSAVATIFADAVGGLVPALAGNVGRGVVLAATLAIASAVNVLGVRQGNRLNVAATAAKLLPLTILLIGGLFAVKGENVGWVQSPHAEKVARASILLIFAFAGIESALVPSGEVREPARTVPRAIFLAMGIVTVFYLGLHHVAQGVLGPALAESGTPLADAAAVALGPWGRTMMLVGAAVSMFGYVSGMTLAVPRALFALGRDGFLPSKLAAVHATHRTPYVAIAVQSVVTFVLAVTSGFEALAILANLTTLLLYAACCLAAWQLRRKDVRAGGIPFRVPAAGVVPVLALAVIAAILTSVTLEEWGVVAGVLAVSTAIFFVTAGHRRRVRAGVDERG